MDYTSRLDVGGVWLDPVVVVQLPAVKVDENLALEDVLDGGDANERRVLPIHGLDFGPDVPSGRLVGQDSRPFPQAGLGGQPRSPRSGLTHVLFPRERQRRDVGGRSLQLLPVLLAPTRRVNVQGIGILPEIVGAGVAVKV